MLDLFRLYSGDKIYIKRTSHLNHLGKHLENLSDFHHFVYHIVVFTILQLLDAMTKDCGIPLTSLQVDGGMTVNDLLMQLQADIVGISVGW